MEKFFDDIFKTYEESYLSLSGLYTPKRDDKYQLLRWFNIRLRLAIDIEVSFM